MIKDTELEKYFTVCYWEQRGAGMTFSSDTDPATMITEQFVEDTRQMTDSLRKWYGTEKIYLMGHSWGSYLGIKTVEKHRNSITHISVSVRCVTNWSQSGLRMITLWPRLAKLVIQIL